MKEKIIKYNGNYFIISLLIYVFMILGYFILSLIDFKMYEINMPIDDKIPFVKEFVFLYYGHYFMPVLTLWLLSFTNKKTFKKAAIALFASVAICFMVFPFFDVRIQRPVVEGNDIFSIVVRFIYDNDKNARCCFPSLHALMAMSTILCALKSTKTHISYRIISTIVGLGVAMSTFFIKQHYFIDAVVGMILYLVVYYIVELIYYIKNKKSLQN